MESWLELEKRFRSLSGDLKYCRLDGQWGSAGEYWRIAGSARTPATEQYEILSSLAGQVLKKVLKGSDEAEKKLLGISDPKIAWYNALKGRSGSFGDHSYARELNEDGSSAGLIFTGSLTNMADAAANLCLALHTSHPILQRKRWWQWLHDNYVKAIIIGGILAIIGAAARWAFGNAG